MTFNDLYRTFFQCGVILFVSIDNERPRKCRKELAVHTVIDCSLGMILIDIFRDAA